MTPDSATRGFLFWAVISLISPNIFNRSQLDTTCLVLVMVWGNNFKCAVVHIWVKSVYLLPQQQMCELMDYQKETGNLPWRQRIDAYLQIISYI